MGKILSQNGAREKMEPHFYPVSAQKLGFDVSINPIRGSILAHCGEGVVEVTGG